MRHAPQFAARLARDTAGNILPIAGMGMLLAAVIVGSAVDISRRYLTMEQIQSACDAGVLAGRRTITTDGFDAASKAAADTYFYANFKDSTQNTHDTTFVATSDEDGKAVQATASTVLDTVVMRLFGFKDFKISIKCGSIMGVGNADVVMVLDTTGSMGSALSGSTRIAVLRTAMKNFYTTMETATANTTGRIRYGFVPYSQSVNVGRLIMARDARFIADTRTYQSRAFSRSGPTNTVSGQSNYTGWSNGTNYGSSSACTRAIPSTAGSWQNYGSAGSPQESSNFGVTSFVTEQPQRYYEYQCSGSTLYFRYRTRSAYSTIQERYTYQPIAYDTSRYKNFETVGTPTGEQGATVNSTWGGCIIERATVASGNVSYSSLTGITPSGALDLNLDALPNVNDDATKWKPVWPEVAYYRYATNGSFSFNPSTVGYQTSSACPARAQLLTEMSRTEFDNYADSLVATGNTYLDIGMIWGGRMISRTGLFKDNVNEEPLNGSEVSRHVIFMTDGVMEPLNWGQSSWGMEFWDRQITSDGSTDQTARHSRRFLAVCEAIKDKGVRVWVIAFTAGLSADLVTCASENSSFLANNAAELNTTFQEIAKQVGELRMVE